MQPHRHYDSYDVFLTPSNHVIPVPIMAPVGFVEILTAPLWRSWDIDVLNLWEYLPYVLFHMSVTKSFEQNLLQMHADDLMLGSWYQLRCAPSEPVASIHAVECWCSTSWEGTVGSYYLYGCFMQSPLFYKLFCLWICLWCISPYSFEVGTDVIYLLTRLVVECFSFQQRVSSSEVLLNPQAGQQT